MSLLVVGVSHKHSPVEVRERLAFPGDSLEKGLTRLCSSGAAEAVILSTCNRVEIYANRDGGNRGEELLDFLREFHGIEREVIEPYVYEFQGSAGAHHLFRVSAGLDSLVLGETQILGQIKEAYARADSVGTVGRLMHELFQGALRTAKRVHTETGLGEALVSVSSVAVDLARKIFGRLDGKRVMLVGAGETAELTLKHFLEAGVSNVLVANRTLENARRLAEPCEGVALELDAISENLPLADIVVASSGAPQALILREDVERALKLRSHSPMFFIDIAVPRDVQPDAHRLDNAYVYNIDDLQQTAAENLGRRQEQAGHAERIVGDEVERFAAEWRSRAIVPIIRSLHQSFRDVAEAEVRKSLKRLGHLQERDQGEVQYLAQRIVQRLLHEPVRELKQDAKEGDPFLTSAVLERIFRLRGVELEGPEPSMSEAKEAVITKKGPEELA
ncbi:MAG: glutamyl-tRNA reductase [Planctomycetota bacterium]